MRPRATEPFAKINDDEARVIAIALGWAKGGWPKLEDSELADALASKIQNFRVRVAEMRSEGSG